jgi:dynein heavy chain
MVTMIMDGDNVLNRVELDFFLKGNTSLEAVEDAKPYAWVSENGWKDMQKLDGLGETWHGFVDNVQNNGPAWKAWYDLETPEQAEIPCDYTKKLSKF